MFIFPKFIDTYVFNFCTFFNGLWHSFYWKILYDNYSIQYGQGLFGSQQHTKSLHPAPDEDKSGVLQLVEWREEAPYG